MNDAVFVTGIGVAAAGAIGVEAFDAVLRSGRSAVSEVPGGAGPLRRAALLPELAFEATMPASAAPRVLRGATPAARSAAVVALQASAQSRIVGRIEPERLAVVLCGHNLSLAVAAERLRAHAGREGFTSPRHALQVWDTHALGVVAELLTARGPGMVAGGHFASGAVALRQAAMLLRTGEADAALCVAPYAALSDLELHALANLGATASVGADNPGRYQPFNPAQAGFVYGEGAACLVLEGSHHVAEGGGGPPLAELAAAVALLGGRAGPEPSAADAARVMRAALAAARMAPGEVAYVNAHATGTPAGDAAEAAAIRDVFGAGHAAPWVNATKALAGHTLFSAGLVGVVATVLQMRGGYMHPDPHLSDGTAAGLRMVGPDTRTANIGAALCNSFGFDGIYGSVVLKRSGGGHEARRH